LLRLWCWRRFWGVWCGWGWGGLSRRTDLKCLLFHYLVLSCPVVSCQCVSACWKRKRASELSVACCTLVHGMKRRRARHSRRAMFSWVSVSLAFWELYALYAVPNKSFGRTWALRGFRYFACSISAVLPDRFGGGFHAVSLCSEIAWSFA
jgi:hypothetical protein